MGALRWITAAAPLKGFIDAFASKGVKITPAEARGPMGLLKIDHIRALAAIPHIKAELEQNLGHAVTDGDINELYNVFESTLLENLVAYSTVKPLCHRNCRCAPAVRGFA